MKTGQIMAVIVCGVFLMISVCYGQQTTEQLLREALEPGQPMPEEGTVAGTSPEMSVMPVDSDAESATAALETSTTTEPVVPESEPATSEMSLSELLLAQEEKEAQEQMTPETESGVVSGTPTFEYDVEYPSKQKVDRESALKALEAAERAEDVTPAVKVYEIAIGEKAMPFTLPTSMGKELAVPGDVDADRIVLAFFRGPWDPYAEEQLNGFAEEYESVKGLGAKIVAISSGSVESLTALRKKNLFSFPVLVDEDLNVSRAFKTYRPSMRMIFPALFILSKDGTVLFFQRGQMGTDYVQIEQLKQLLEKYESR